MTRLEDVLRCLEDVFQDVLKTFWRRLQNALKTSWRCLEDVFARRLEDVLKTSWRRLEDVLKTSWRRLENVLKTSWRRIAKTNILVLTKTSSEDEDERRLQDVFIKTNVCWVSSMWMLNLWNPLVPPCVFHTLVFPVCTCLSYQSDVQVHLSCY